LLGGEAVDPNVQTILNANLPLPIEAYQPLRNADISALKPHERKGPMSEWSVAFGLALKLTKEHFANRDGKKRDPNAPREDVRPMSAAEVVDLNGALNIPAPSSSASVPTNGSSTENNKEQPEVLRA
jgi:hypothetical protein